MRRERIGSFGERQDPFPRGARRFFRREREKARNPFVYAELRAFESGAPSGIRTLRIAHKQKP